jgi:diguanylate cyclase (GGDEF)-like protein
MAVTLEKLAKSVNHAHSLEELSRPILELLHRITRLESTYLTTIDEKRGLQHVLYARNVGDLTIPEGLDVAWGEALCRRALEEKQFLTQDVPARWGDSDTARALGIKTYLSTPVYTEDGALYGTLCGASAKSVCVTNDVQEVLQLFALLIANHVDRERHMKAANARVVAAEARAGDMQLVAGISALCLEYEELEPLLQKVAAYFKVRKCWSRAVPFIIHQNQLRVLEESTPEIESVIKVALLYREKSSGKHAEAIKDVLTKSLQSAGWDSDAALDLISASTGIDLQGGILLHAQKGIGRPMSEQSLIYSCSNALALFVERYREHALLEAANVQLKQHAMTDPLTGLPNRRYLVEEMGRMIARINRTGETLYVAFVDLDNFKKINDSYGRDVGDQFLQALAACLSRTVRSNDIVARYGGDEFVMAAIGNNPITGMEEAALADRITRAMSGEIKLRDLSLQYDGPSVGVITWQGNVTADPDLILKEADKVMYTSKMARRAKEAKRATH